MSPEQLRSDIDTIRSVLAEGTASRDPHRVILAGANFVCGLFVLLAVPVVLIAFGIPTFAVVLDDAGGKDPAVATLVVVGAAVLSILLAIAAPFLVAGWGLLKNRSWGPVAAIVAAVLNAFNVPLGTAIAVYTFWALANGRLQTANPGA